MINGLEGVPGSGKSYEATVFHVLAAVQSGRKVITNLPLHVEMFAAIDPSFPALIEIRKRPLPVRGTWDAEREHAFELFEDGRVEPRPGARVFGHVWDYYTEWKSDRWAGPLFVVDECHIALPRIGTDRQVVEWFKLHRHFNVDVLLMTQRFRGVDDDIASLMGVLVKVRKADILGKKDSYIRKVHGGYRGAVISTDERKYQPQFFPLYKSHTQGASVAEAEATDVTPFLVQFNRIKWSVVALAVVGVVWAFWPHGKHKPKEWQKKPAWLLEVEAQHARGSVPTPPAAAASAPAPSTSAPAPGDVVADADPEPFGKQQVHITGWARLGDRTVYTFSVSAGGARLFDVRQRDLEMSGYTFQALGECAGMLRWKTKVRPVVCDSPYFAAGTQSTPVVLAGVPKSPSPVGQ